MAGCYLPWQSLELNRPGFRRGWSGDLVGLVLGAAGATDPDQQIGRAAGRGKGENSVGGGILKKKKKMSAVAYQCLSCTHINCNLCTIATSGMYRLMRVMYVMRYCDTAVYRKVMSVVIVATDNA